jgi:histidinol-phosphate aminotransferase
VTVPRLRPDIDSLPAYKAGQRPPERPDLTVYKISSNEVPYPPLPSVVDAIARAAQEIHRYPDPASSRLVAALAQRHGVAEDQIALGTGSVALCGHITSAVAGPGDEVVYAWRSFEAYPIWTQIAGAASVQVPLLPGERHDLPAMLAAITPRTRLVFVCTPNNPTGAVITEAELTGFLDQVPSDVLVVLDEAYTEFVTRTDVADGVAMVRRYPNLVLLRTFSKAYGLAALRVGFAIAHPAVAAAIRKTATPFGVSTVAEEAAVASLAAEDELMERVRAVVVERERVLAALRAQGWNVVDSQANFVWLRLGDRTTDYAAACEEAGITVRPFAGEGVRITVGEPEANDRVITVSQAFLTA